MGTHSPGYYCMANAKKQSNLKPSGKVLADSYFESVCQPLYALCFLMPFMILYEVGTILVNTDQISHVQSNVAAFTWILGIARLIGVSNQIVWAFPVLVVVIITFFLHLSSANSWRIRFPWLCWMGFESMFLTLPLFVIGIIMNGSRSFAAGPLGNVYYARLVIGIGAGIYEELVFRLILLGLLLLFFDDVLRFGHTLSIIMATLISAALFSAHHYYGIDISTGQLVRLDEALEVSSFLFRMAAGVYFAIIFHYRGYGITAGTHAFYNVFYFTFFA